MTAHSVLIGGLGNSQLNNSENRLYGLKPKCSIFPDFGPLHGEERINGYGVTVWLDL